MGADLAFFCDLKEGFRQDFPGNTPPYSPGSVCSLEWNFFAPEAGTFYLQFKSDFRQEILINGIPAEKMGLDFPLCYQKLKLKQGNNLLKITLRNNTSESLTIPFSARMTDARGWMVPDRNSYQEGIGSAIPSAGRFGYSKGDGILDCSVSRFGLLTKPNLFGHPEYRRSRLWQVSILPPGVDSAGELNLEYRPSDNESVHADWTGVEWKRTVRATESYYSRKAGSEVVCNLSYSTLSPFVLMETNDPAVRLSGEPYRKALIPLASGTVVREARGGVFYDRAKDGDLAENRILFFGTGEFPEVPLLCILKESPEKITGDIDLVFRSSVDWILIGFPFGFEVFSPEDINSAWLERAKEQGRFHHSIALARPVKCREYFKIEEKQVRILQMFDYRILTDSLQTPAVRWAPLPPVLGIPGANGTKVDPRTVSMRFPTKYGPLTGVHDSNYSEYVLPIPSYSYEFPMTPEKTRFEDFEAFTQYHTSMTKMMNPGSHSFLYHWTIPMRMFAQLDETQRTRLEELIRQGLAKVTDPEAKYTGPNGKECCMWYRRTEPFSGVKYRMSYLHVGGYRNLPSCDRETVEHFNRPFIEIDWGNALALYAVCYGAMLTDSWDLVRKQWDVIKEIFDYFLVLQDWACMASAYCENGHAWNDGANYGAYPAFIRMAEMVGDRRSMDLGMYAYAKMCAERVAQFRSSEVYFPQFYNRLPWLCPKTFNEELNPFFQFTNYPEEVLRGGYRHETLYNMTTEGFYQEAMRFYAESIPEGTVRMLKSVENAFGNSMYENIPQPIYHSLTPDFIGGQEQFTYLMLSWYTGYKSAEELQKLVEKAYRNNRLPKEFLGTELSYRRVPENWCRAYLNTVLRSGKLPSVCAWKNLRIDSIDYPVVRITCLRPDAWIEFSSRNEIKYTGNGAEGKGSGRFRIPIDGDCEIRFSS